MQLYPHGFYQLVYYSSYPMWHAYIRTLINWRSFCGSHKQWSHVLYSLATYPWPSKLLSLLSLVFESKWIDCTLSIELQLYFSFEVALSNCLPSPCAPLCLAMLVWMLAYCLRWLSSVLASSKHLWIKSLEGCLLHGVTWGISLVILVVVDQLEAYMECCDLSIALHPS